jgi:xylose isomerase
MAKSTSYFPDVQPIRYEGPDSKNPLAFKHYNPDEKVLGKTMKEHLRFSVCYWHCMKNGGADPFGAATRVMPWNAPGSGDEMRIAENTMHAMFEFISKLGVQFWCFHDRDIAPEAATFKETNRRLDRIVKLAGKLQNEHNVKLLWGTACLFAHPRYMSGAGTSPFLDAFVHAAAQVKKAFEATCELGGGAYLFWGGREGYDSLLNTNLARELDHLARLLHMTVDFKKQIGFRGALYIEPKPKEPTTHQYDHDASACHAFLQKYKLDQHFTLNIEANHATLAGHSFHHELEYCVANHLLGSIDANRGDQLIGWDTDQFPTDLYDTTLCMMSVLKNGGFPGPSGGGGGGLNFDAKVRRQSVDPVDLFHAHIGGMDAFARGLKIAAKAQQDGRLATIVKERYASWDSALGKKIEQGKCSLADLEKIAHQANIQSVPSSRQELCENILNEMI